MSLTGASQGSRRERKAEHEATLRDPDAVLVRLLNSADEQVRLRVATELRCRGAEVPPDDTLVALQAEIRSGLMRLLAWADNGAEGECVLWDDLAVVRRCPEDGRPRPIDAGASDLLTAE
jgi:hypothetical protein